MREEDREETVKRYNSRLEKFGYSEEALGWTRNKNDVRLAQLVDQWQDELEGAHIGDFGCGFGDFYGFLTDQKKLRNFSYTGIDLNENLINIGRQKYPKANFWVGDIAVDPIDEKFDFVFSSGVFNHVFPLGGEYDFIESCFTKLWQMTKKGLAANFLSDQVDYRLENTHHSNPGKILEICYKLSRNVVLRNDCMPFEFAVYIRKDFVVDPKKVIFVPPSQ